MRLSTALEWSQPSLCVAVRTRYQAPLVSSDVTSSPRWSWSAQATKKLGLGRMQVLSTFTVRVSPPAMNDGRTERANAPTIHILIRGTS